MKDRKQTIRISVACLLAQFTYPLVSYAQSEIPGLGSLPAKLGAGVDLMFVLAVLGLSAWLIYAGFRIARNDPKGWAHVAAVIAAGTIIYNKAEIVAWAGQQ